MVINFDYIRHANPMLVLLPSHTYSLLVSEAYLEPTPETALQRWT